MKNSSHRTRASPTAAQVRRELNRHADADKAAFLARFFKAGKGEYAQGDRFLGVTVPQQRRIARQFASLPAWMRLLLSVFIPPLREMPEMQYQWEEPFVIDDRPFRERFGVHPEKAARAAAATVAWARAHYARA